MSKYNADQRAGLLFMLGCMLGRNTPMSTPCLEQARELVELVYARKSAPEAEEFYDRLTGLVEAVTGVVPSSFMQAWEWAKPKTEDDGY